MWVGPMGLQGQEEGKGTALEKEQRGTEARGPSRLLAAPRLQQGPPSAGLGCSPSCLLHSRCRGCCS